MNFMQGSLARNARAVFEQEGSNLAIPVPAAVAQRLNAYSKPAVTLGVRPEHIHARRPAGIETLAPFKALIEVVEPVGNEVFLCFSISVSTQHVARIATDAPPPVGKPCELLSSRRPSIIPAIGGPFHGST